MLRTGLAVGVTAGLLVMGGAPAWAEDPPADGSGGGTSSSADPTAGPEPTAEPTREPTGEPTEEPTAEPSQEPTAEPTDAPVEDTDGGAAPECGTPGPDGIDPCVLFATGGGVPAGAVEKDASGNGSVGSAQLPRTGDETVLLALAGLGLVLVGSGSVVAGRPRRTP